MSENEALYEYMHELGFLVVLKPTVDIAQPNTGQNQPDSKKEQGADKEKTSVKGNVDAELVLYAMKEWPNYAKALIVSGDGDFFSLAEYLDKNNKLEKILTPNWQYSSLLKPFEQKIIRLDQLRKNLAYKDRVKKRK